MVQSEVTLNQTKVVKPEVIPNKTEETIEVEQTQQPGFELVFCRCGNFNSGLLVESSN